MIEIGGERETVGKDNLVESPAKIPHRWINESDAEFKVLVAKVPGSVTGTKIL